MIFTKPQQSQYLIQMPPKSNRRISSVSNNMSGHYSMFSTITSTPISNINSDESIPTNNASSINILNSSNISTTRLIPPVLNGQGKKIEASDRTKLYYRTNEARLRELTMASTLPPQPPQSQLNTQRDLSAEKPKSKPMKWGEPTWFLFHTLAEKIKDNIENFPLFKTQFLKTIYLICTALPCPDCSKHATEYLNGINFNTINTKEDLRMMLFTFHNVVNQKKNFEIFKYEDLEPKYSAMNTVKIIQQFMVAYSPAFNKTLSIDLNKHYRQTVSSTLVQWFNDNINKFEP